MLVGFHCVTLLLTIDCYFHVLSPTLMIQIFTTNEAVLQVITQSHFLPWDLQNFIYLMSLMTIS